MTIINIGHDLNYEIERLVTMYFDGKNTKTVKSREELEENYIETKLEKTDNYWNLYIKIVYNGKVYKDEKRIQPDESEYNKYCERAFGVLLAKNLTQITGIELKWGTLTGIRPVKLIRGEFAKGKTYDEVWELFHDKLMVSDEKLNLALKTMKNETVILDKNKNNSYSLYFSMPFCPSRCHYCSFVSHSINTKKAKELAPKYVKLLCKELIETSNIAKELGLKLETIYFGGGTPTTMTADQLRMVTKTISENYDVKNVIEYTVEAGRPDTLDREKLVVLKNAGVTRISINPQSLDDSVLEVIGRNHTAKQTIDSFNLAREVGFDNINMDVIAGLPTDTIKTFKQTIDKIIKLSPENVTVHTLTIKRSSDYAEEKKNIIEKVHEVDEMVDYAQKALMENEFEPYYLYRQKNTIGNLENVGFSKKGYEGYYNIYIMDETHTILANGAGAVSKLKEPNENNIQRIFNFKFPYEYITRFDEIISRKEKVKEFYEQCKSI